ncbi:hypothetical protein VN97_g930 [Penicillium thymicola]|uniref:Uncharacterized protein n=1 Tax=Penicillium thymicola TaxID=293382 RepID=A0AAI9XCR4_PENTH|nr:hypothetical protein VN97_g930 [Penicillium thymicola]
MTPSPFRIAARESDVYADSTMIKMQRLIHIMHLSMTETTIKEFHDTLCRKSLQDIAWIHVQFDYPNPFFISSEEPTESLINPCVEHGSDLRDASFTRPDGHWEGINTPFSPFLSPFFSSFFNTPGPHCTSWFPFSRLRVSAAV